MVDIGIQQGSLSSLRVVSDKLENEFLFLSKALKASNWYPLQQWHTSRERGHQSSPSIDRKQMKLDL